MNKLWLLGMIAMISYTVPGHARCKDGYKVIHMSAGAPASGNTIAGPCDIIVQDLNPARYDYAFNSAITFGTAPDLWSKLLGINTADNAKSTPAPSPAPGAMADENAADAEAKQNFLIALPQAKKGHANPTIVRATDRLNQLIKATDATISTAHDSLDKGNTNITGVTAPGEALDREIQRFNTYQGLRRQANAATSAASVGGRSLLLFLQQSDSDVVNGGYPLLVQDISTLLTQGAIPPPPPDSGFIAGTKVLWPDQQAISSIRTQLDSDTSRLQVAVQAFTAFKTSQELSLTGFRDTLVTLREEIKKELENVSDAIAQQEGNTYVNNIKLHLNLIDDQKSQMASLLTDMNSAMKRDSDIATGLADIELTGKPYADFRAAQDALLEWRGRLSRVVTTWNNRDDTDPFTKTFQARCEFAFSRTKTTTIQLVKTDKMPGTTATPTVTMPLLTVECTSPFTLSAGVAFSTIGEHEFAIQPAPVAPGSTNTQNTFIEVTDSGIHPLPLGMVHVRLYESSDKLSWHGSFGLAGNLRSQSAGGSNAEFLIGGSLALFRTVFLTPGLYIGQRTSLGAGFTLNNAVPASITQPPLQKSYKPAFGFAITFTKP